MASSTEVLPATLCKDIIRNLGTSVDLPVSPKHFGKPNTDQFRSLIAEACSFLESRVRVLASAALRITDRIEIINYPPLVSAISQSRDLHADRIGSYTLALSTDRDVNPGTVKLQRNVHTLCGVESELLLDRPPMISGVHHRDFTVKPAYADRIGITQAPFGGVMEIEPDRYHFAPPLLPGTRRLVLHALYSAPEC